MVSRIYRPCFSAFLLPVERPIPGAPPCHPPPANETKEPESSAMAHARGCTQCLCSLYGVMAQSETRGAAADVHAVPIIAAAAKDEAHVAELPQRLHKPGRGRKVVIALPPEHRSPLARR